MRNAYFTKIREKISGRALLAAALFTMQCYYSTAQVSVTATAGTTSNSYTTLKTAIDNINLGTHQGNIVIKIHSNTTETSAITLVESGNVSGASYTSVLIAPADTATIAKVVSFGVSGATLLTLDNADNVTIDGRPLGVGTSRLLTFAHTSNTAASHTLVLQNGATNGTFGYTNFLNAAIGTIAAHNIRVLTGSNSNNNFHHDSITGGNFGLEVNGTAGTPNNISIVSNKFANQKQASIRLGNTTGQSGVGDILIDSNRFTHYVATTTGGYQAINIASIEPASTVTFIRNQVYNLNGSAANFLHGIFFSPLAASGTLIVRNNSIAIGSAALPNTPCQYIRCFFFGGTMAATAVVENNTFRIGGIHTAGTNNPISIAANKSNSNTGSSFTFKNNLCINTRTGTNNYHVGTWISTPVTGTNITDYNTIWAGPVFPAVWGVNLYGTEATYRTAAFPNEQNSTFGNVDFVTDSTPVPAATNGGRLLLGTPLVSVPNDLFGTPRSSVDPYRGAYEGAPLVDSIDASVVIIYTYGKIPIGTDDTVRAIVRNNGTRALNGLYVKLTGTASNFADSIQINLSRFSDSIVYLPPYTPSVLGPDTLRAIIADDQNASNNVSAWLRENTLNSLAYTQTTLPRWGNVGTNPEGEIVAKFYTPVSNFVNQVNVNFTNPGFVQPFPFQVVIYEDSGSAGPKSAPFWVSATQNTVNGVFNLSLPSVPVSGNFYIGVRQTTANNIGFAYQQEIPIRNKTFFFRQGANFQNLAWNDFAVNPANAFRFMIEPRLKINDDLGVIDLNTPGAACANLGLQAVKFRIQNLGLLTQNFSSNNLSLYGTIRKPSGTLYSFGPVTVNSGMLISDDFIDVDLTSSFDFDSVGTYTFKAWTVFGPDNNKVNDTLPELQRTIYLVNNMPYAQNFNAATTVPEGWQAGRFFVAANAGTGGTNAMRVNINNTSTFAANASLQSPRVSNITATTVLRFDYRVINNLGGTAATLLNTDSIKILVSTDCGNTFTQVHLINGVNHVSSATMQPYEIPLGTYVGSDIMIKFMLDWFGTTNDAVIDIDNIRVVDASNDLGIKSVSSPCRSVILGSSAFAPEVTVSNFGTSAQAGATVNVSITGPVNYTGSFSIPSISGNSSTTVNMSTMFNPSTAGTYTLKAWTSLLNDGDPTNDTITLTFNVTDIALGTNAVNALTFGSAQSRVNVASSSTLTVSAGLTIEAWINRSAGVTRRSIVTKDSAVGFVQYALELNDTNGLAFTVYTTSGFYVFTSDVSVPTGFTHVAATFNGTTATLYINGAIAGSTSVTAGTILPLAYEMHIGNNNGFTSAFGGAIDELRIWNVSRTENEIRSNMHMRLANAPSIDLVGYYRMDEASGNLFITDASGNCNAGVFAATAPTRTAAVYPLGASASATQTVAFDGIQFFTGTDVAMYFTGVTGTDTVYVHKFTTAPIGTSPATSPGGVTAVYPGYWVIYKYGNGNFSSTNSNIEFTLMSGSLLSSVSNSDLKLFNRALGLTGNWTLTSGSATNTSFANQTVQYSLAPTAFSNTLSIGANNNPLPVRLIRLSASADKNDAVLHWSTASETNNKGFIVERSLDGKNFTELDFVRGAGNSNRVNDYSYADKNIFTTTAIAYYRLKQVDINEAYTYTDVVPVKAGEVYKPQVIVYPNPVLTTLNVEIGALTSSTATITIMDITGKLVRSEDMPLTEGFNKLTIDDIYVLNNGVYLVNIASGGQVLYTGKLVKTE